jgi:hypothetical protein
MEVERANAVIDMKLVIADVSVRFKSELMKPKSK